MITQAISSIGQTHFVYGNVVSMAMFLLLIKTHKISHGAWLQKGNENLNMCIFEESRPVNIYLPWLWSISAVERSTVFIPPSLICPLSSPARPCISFHQLPSPSFSFPPCSPLLQSLSVTSPSWKGSIFNSMGTCVHYDMGWIRKLMQVTNQCTLCILKCKQWIDPPLPFFRHFVAQLQMTVEI